jgi:hypothetical protein
MKDILYDIHMKMFTDRMEQIDKRQKLKEKIASVVRQGIGAFTPDEIAGRIMKEIERG